MNKTRKVPQFSQAAPKTELSIRGVIGFNLTPDVTKEMNIR